MHLHDGGMGLRQMSARTRIRGRRRIAMSAGLFFVACLTACIFDKGEYQGGGRLDKGATANTAGAEAGPAPTDGSTPPPVDAGTDTSLPPPMDAGSDG